MNINTVMKSLAIFGAGVSVGAFASYKIVDRKYKNDILNIENKIDDINTLKSQIEDILNIENKIDDINTLKSQIEEVLNIENKIDDINTLKSQIEEVLNSNSSLEVESTNDIQEEALQELSYVDYSVYNKKEKYYDDINEKNKTIEKNIFVNDEYKKPHIIRQEDFDDPHYDDYAKIGLIFYRDHVLVDEMGDRFEDIDELVGIDNIEFFQGYSEDSIYIRNEVKQIDYEIIKDEDCYIDKIIEADTYIKEEDYD